MPTRARKPSCGHAPPLRRDAFPDTWHSADMSVNPAAPGELPADGPGTATPRDPIADVIEGARLVAAAEAELRSRVLRARTAGVTWQQLGDALRVTRQAAFKRFANPVDPDTGRPIPRHSADVLGITRGVFTHLADGDYDWIAQQMTHACARQLTRRRVLDVWRDVLAEVGELESFTQPQVRSGDGAVVVDGDPGQAALPAVGRVLLQHEAGEMAGHVMLNRTGKIAGILVGPPAAEPTWPF